MQIFQTLALQFHGLKKQFSSLTGASEELLHVHAGLLIFVLTAFILRRHFRSPIPISCVVFFAIFNELIDQIANVGWRPYEPFLDIANTLFWPLILFLLARRWR